ncbi:MAG: EAL domain-containing protein [Burkholderiaceae bacterium]
MESTLDLLWLLLASLLVLSMQAGFLLLEAGRVRSKNSVSVAQKNVTDLVVSWVTFYAFGYLLMTGLTVPGQWAVVGISVKSSTKSVLDFVYLLGFCAAAASIVSGGIAERMAFRAYLAMTFVVAGFIFPLVARAVWGEAGQVSWGAWLAQWGFVDFAGAAVVHGVGAIVALACIIFIGPRIGRFDDTGRPQPIAGHNAVISLLGTLVLLLGWFGFNAGALSPSDPLFAQVLLNTCSAAAFGAFAGMLVGVRIDKGIFNPSRVTSGLLGGLVSITACAHLTSEVQSVIVGVAGGAVATGGAHWLLVKCKLDDPLDVVSTHGMAGFVGIVAVALVGSVEQLPAGSRMSQLTIQIIGYAAIAGFSFAMAWLSLRGFAAFMSIRVSAEVEQLGLNHTEHGEGVGVDRLQAALAERLDSKQSFDQRFDTEDGDDAAELAHAMNQLLDKHDRARQAVEQSRSRFEDFAQTASDWLWESDARLVLMFSSTKAGSRNGAETEDLAGRRLFDVVRLPDSVLGEVRAAIRTRHPLAISDATLELPSGDELLIEVRGRPYFDSDGEYLGYRGTFNDVTERRSAERRATYLSRHDELTGLANRRALSEDLARLQSTQGPAQGLVVAALDLDGFKRVNDANGHMIGDALLKAVAKRLDSSMRGTDRLFRTGGDEFVLLLPNFELHDIRNSSQAWCERLIGKISQPYELENLSLEIGASIGIALYPDHGADATELIHLADLALYAAKGRGKGQAAFFEPEMDEHAKDLIQLEADLKAAVTREELYLDYQPQVDSHSGAITGFEALVRWQHPTRGVLTPNVFIPIAERCKLMGSIGSQVLHKACQFASQWPIADGAEPLRVAVNVSPSQFTGDQIVNDVMSSLEQSGLSADRLELEITEDLLIEDVASVSQTLMKIRELGVSIAIDDFGSGQTSLQYLNQFPISKLKIDRAFVRNLSNDLRAQEITQSIVMLGHKLGCIVTAEGVEKGDQRQLLQDWQCDELQGFMFAKPMPPAEALELIAKSQATAKASASVQTTASQDSEPS